MKPSEQNMREILHRAASLPALFGVDDDMDETAQDLLVRVRCSLFLFFVFSLDTRQQMLDKDPGRRATITEIQQHSYFASM